ncbi:hypothetical protein L1887_03355 [Cichorium endivia]|nr:hypothetical protein L1887_03355 [Cichorium endivia]
MVGRTWKEMIRAQMKPRFFRRKHIAAANSGSDSSDSSKEAEDGEATRQKRRLTEAGDLDVGSAVAVVKVSSRYRFHH